jgi:hypothetical protein
MVQDRGGFAAMVAPFHALPIHFAAWQAAQHRW